MHTDQQFDLAIIGEGITGLSTAFHLQRLGASRICILSSESKPSVSSKAAGLSSGGCLDNITRISHRHGVENAASFWDWMQTAFERLVSFAEDDGLSFALSKRVRWIMSPDEWAEAEQGVRIFRQVGFSAELLTRELALRQGLSPQGICRGTQIDGTQSLYINPTDLMASLKAKTSAVPRLPEAKAIESKGGKITITTQGGKVHAEAVIVANHLSLAELIPSLKPALVSYADQWHEWKLEESAQALTIPQGTLFSWRHGHYWGGVPSPQRVRIGGARFLRPLAGFEATEAHLDPKIEKHLREAWNELFPQHKLADLVRSETGLDCWPSDELPIIGPMFGEPRLLLATGFMGQGLSMGFYAGCCLAELVQGLRPPLPRILWPERFRNLPQET